MAAAVQSVVSTFTLLIVIMYVFSIIMTGWCKDGGNVREDFEELFCGVDKSMFTLFQIMLLDDACEILREAGKETWQIILLLVLYILLTSFTVLNMLIGIMCEIITATKQQEGES